jgi:cytochrome oxidase Cu insertion factor (SCO1/SenC/PrrC family)
MKTGGIKHTSVIFLVGPDGQFLRKFSANETPEAIAKALAALARTG